MYMYMVLYISKEKLTGQVMPYTSTTEILVLEFRFNPNSTGHYNMTV